MRGQPTLQTFGFTVSGERSILRNLFRTAFLVCMTKTAGAMYATMVAHMHVTSPGSVGSGEGYATLDAFNTFVHYISEFIKIEQNRRLVRAI